MIKLLRINLQKWSSWDKWHGKPQACFIPVTQQPSVKLNLLRPWQTFAHFPKSFRTLNVMMKDKESYFKKSETPSFCHFEYWKIVSNVALRGFLFEWQNEKCSYMYIRHSSWISHMYHFSFSAFLLVYFSDFRNIFG